MTRKQGKVHDSAVAVTSERIDREDAIEALYKDNPSLRALHERGLIDQETFKKAKRLSDSGATEHPFTALIAALRAERELQALSLTDIAERTGMDRAAVHKLEIGLNRNPTCTTLDRYADALGMQIAWLLLPKGQLISAPRRGRVCPVTDEVRVHLTARKATPKATAKGRSRSRNADKGTESSTDPASVS